MLKAVATVCLSFCLLLCTVASTSAAENKGKAWDQSAALSGTWTVDAVATAEAIFEEVREKEYSHLSAGGRIQAKEKLAEYFTGITVTIDIAQRKYLVAKESKAEGKETLENRTITNVEIKDGLIYLKRGSGVGREGYLIRPDGTVTGYEMKDGKRSVVFIMRKK